MSMTRLRVEMSRSALFDGALITHFDVVPGSGSHLL
jgi:hypothetical protein